jgi:sulfatase maturation enzyme AslB (radical SAM superfamily)
MIQIDAIQRYVSFPIPRVHMELTNICNFRCVFCPSSLMTRKRGYMDAELAKKIIEDLKAMNIAEKITFHVMGEPMLHPQVFQIIAHGRDKGLKVGLTTNGSLFTRENRERLLALDLDQINISLQTPDEESFSQREAGVLTAEEYFQNILDFISLLIQSNSNTTIKVHLLNPKSRGLLVAPQDKGRLMRLTPDLHTALARWTREIYGLEGIQDRFRERKVLERLKKISLNKWNVLEIYPRIFLETYILDNWGNALVQNPIRRARFGYCPAISDHFSILWNGDLTLCCRDFDGHTTIGNLWHQDLPEILNSPDLIPILKGFQRFQVIHPYCQRCLGGTSYLQLFFRETGSILLWKFLKPYLYVNKKLFR